MSKTKQAIALMTILSACTVQDLNSTVPVPNGTASVTTTQPTAAATPSVVTQPVVANQSETCVPTSMTSYTPEGFAIPVGTEAGQESITCDFSMADAASTGVIYNGSSVPNLYPNTYVVTCQAAGSKPDVAPAATGFLAAYFRDATLSPMTAANPPIFGMAPGGAFGGPKTGSMVFIFNTRDETPNHMCGSSQ